MTPDMTTTNVLLGIMAAVSLLQALAWLDAHLAMRCLARYRWHSTHWSVTAT